MWLVFSLARDGGIGICGEMRVRLGERHIGAIPPKRSGEGYTEISTRLILFAQMVELVYTEVSKSSASRLAGSSPALGTK